MQSSDVDGLIGDVGTALGRILPRDGSAPMTNDLNVASQSVSNVARALTLFDAVPFEQARTLFVVRPSTVTRNATNDSTPGGDQGDLERYDLTFDSPQTLEDGLVLLFELPSNLGPANGGGLSIALSAGGEGKYVSTPAGDQHYTILANFPVLVVFSEDLDKWVMPIDPAPLSLVPAGPAPWVVVVADSSIPNNTRPTYTWDLDTNEKILFSRFNTNAPLSRKKAFRVTLSGGSSGVSYRFMHDYHTADTKEVQPEWVLPVGKTITRQFTSGNNHGNRFAGCIIDVDHNGNYHVTYPFEFNETI